MHIFKFLMALPALTALAMPVVDNEANTAVVELDSSVMIKREDTLLELDRANLWKRDEDVAVAKHFAPNHHISVTADKHQVWARATAIQQPNIPEFIDTAACICGLRKDRDTLPHNGELIEMWRCTAAVDEDIGVGTHGKWYNTTLPSQELSGLGEPRDWDENPPYVNETFVLRFDGKGGAFYELLNPPVDEAELQPGDVNCTGVKDQAASAAFYASQD